MKEKINLIIDNNEYYLINNQWYDQDDTLVFDELLIETLNSELDIDTPKLKPEGLGDVISEATKALGIKECKGCKKRKNRLNRMFNFLKKKRDFTPDEIDFIKDINSRQSMSREESIRLFELYNEITGSKAERCKCPGLHITLIKRLINLI